MSVKATPDTTMGIDYQRVFDLSGVPTENQIPGNHRFITGPEGEIYAIPTEIVIDGSAYYFSENGVAISKQVEMADDNPQVLAEPRVIIHPYARIMGQIVLGHGTIIESSAELQAGITTDSDVVVGAYSTVGKNVQLGEGVVIEGKVHIQDNVSFLDNVLVGSDSYVDTGTEIGNDTTIEKNSWIGKNTQIGEGVKIGHDSMIGDSSKLGDDVLIEENVTVLSNVTVGEGSRILKDTEVRKNKTIKPFTVVYPPTYKRANKAKKSMPDTGR